MRIDTFAFGSIVIDGRKYTSDLIIYPDGRVVTYWRRKRGHKLSSDDIRELIDSQPEVIIAGTGVYGLVKPEKDLQKMLQKRRIEFFAERNKKAMELFISQEK
ncbi:MAG: MTH938/NDUFAF3 family protein [Pseudomonadota bacterium]